MIRDLVNPTIRETDAMLLEGVIIQQCWRPWRPRNQVFTGQTPSASISGLTALMYSQINLCEFPISSHVRQKWLVYQWLWVLDRLLGSLYVIKAFLTCVIVAFLILSPAMRDCACGLWNPCYGTVNP